VLPNSNQNSILAAFKVSPKPLLSTAEDGTPLPPGFTVPSAAHRTRKRETASSSHSRPSRRPLGCSYPRTRHTTPGAPPQRSQLESDAGVPSVLASHLRNGRRHQQFRPRTEVVVYRLSRKGRSISDITHANTLATTLLHQPLRSLEDSIPSF
jgi:hypothetical protein